jgi:1,4-dihydroxy-2-naphthoate polyprenyltransferase
LLSGLALFVFGVSLAMILLGYLVLLPAHLSISYSNDYFDVDVDKYDKPTFFSGGSGILVAHPELRKPAQWIAITLIFFSLVFGLVFQIVYSLEMGFICFVLLGNLVGWFYSAPPIRLAYRGLGELSMMLSIGLLIPGLGYLVTRGPMNQDEFLFIAPLMLYGLAFILTVEIPDMEADRLGNKRTWVARKGRGFGFTVIAASLLCATLFFLCFPWLRPRIYPLDFHVLGILSLIPLAAGCFGMLKRPVDKQSATRVVTGIMISLATFCILADGYLIYLAFTR